jgi:hypothetical protein
MRSHAPRRLSTGFTRRNTALFLDPSELSTDEPALIIIIKEE